MNEEERCEALASADAECSEIFEIKARRCQRCGGILLSEFGLKHGMGHVCKRKYEQEHAPIDENQLTLFIETAEPNGFSGTEDD